MEQLSNISKGLREMNDEICEAMRIDLGRDLFINYMGEAVLLEASVRFDAQNLNEWMKDHSEELELLLAPGAVKVRYEPLGVVGVFGSWNAPFVTTLKPMI